MSTFLQIDTGLFLGRFHSLVVHLPIGFLILAVIFLALSFSKRFQYFQKALPLTLGLGSLSALGSVILGFLLAEEGGYPEGSLLWHKIMGITVTIISFICFFLVLGFFEKEGRKVSIWDRISLERIEGIIESKKKLLAVLLLAGLTSISVAGHLGGNLTHGEDYLYVYAPSFVQEALMNDENESAGEIPLNADSVLVFKHLIEPVIQAKCSSCHNDEVQKGGLNVNSFESLLEGGESGAALSSGSPESSELFKRVTMDPKSLKFMPPKGPALSFTEISLIQQWIEEDMSAEVRITDDKLSEKTKKLIEDSYGISTKPKAFYELHTVEAASEEILRKIGSEKFRISTISPESNFLDVVAKGKITEEDLKKLMDISEQITWLDLSNSGMEDSWLKSISQMPNLTRLIIHNNPITSKGLASISTLENLELVNLYNTKVDDEGLDVLIGMKNLKRVYLWNSKVSSEKLRASQESRPDLNLDGGTMGKESR